jgi:hypothetical protein
MFAFIKRAIIIEPEMTGSGTRCIACENQTERHLVGKTDQFRTNYFLSNFIRSAQMGGLIIGLILRGKLPLK